MAGGSSASSGSKRKRTAPAFYAVKVGFAPGIYQSWDDAKEQTSGFKNPVFKKFSMLTEAEEFLKGESVSVPKSGKSKYYGVQVGHTPGVYADWSAVLEQVTGFKGAKQKRFETLEEAQAFVNEAQQGGASSHTTSTPISLNGHLDSTIASEMDSRKSTKKQKQNDGSAMATATNGEYEAGTGPLPPDAEDGFDRAIKHGRPGGPEIEYKTQEELNLRKLQPTGDFEGVLDIYTDGASKGNGQLGAYAGFGIWFGPNDPR
jgi:ribonuclease HI